MKPLVINDNTPEGRKIQELEPGVVFRIGSRIMTRMRDTGGLRVQHDPNTVLVFVFVHELSPFTVDGYQRDTIPNQVYDARLDLGGLSQ